MPALDIVEWALTYQARVRPVTPKQRFGTWPAVAVIIIAFLTLLTYIMYLLGVITTNWPHYASMITNYLTTSPSWIFEAGAVAAGIFYLYYRRVNHRMLKVRCADMLLVELGNIKTDVDLAKGNYTPDNKAYHDLPRARYDGLITSNNISHFDMEMQQKLHSLYTNIHRYNLIAEESRQAKLSGGSVHYRGYPNRPMAQANLEDLVKRFEDVFTTVEKFRYKHEPWGSARFIANMFNLLD